MGRVSREHAFLSVSFSLQPAFATLRLGVSVLKKGPHRLAQVGLHSTCKHPASAS